MEDFVVQVLQDVVLLTLQECILLHRMSAGYRGGSKREGKCWGFFVFYWSWSFIFKKFNFALAFSLYSVYNNVSHA